MANLLQNALDEYYKIFNLGNVFPHALFPDNFELYFFAFELEDGNKVTDRFIFPINPKQINIQESKITSVTKTSGGVVALFNTTYNPLNISITGDFGRDFKLLIGNIKDKMNLKDNNRWVDLYENVKPFVNPYIKTGFGAFNELKRIIRKSSQLTPTGKPYKTIFYNLAFSEIYIVQILDFNPSMTDDRNMIHNYTLSMKAINYYLAGDIYKTKFKDFKSSIRDSVQNLKNNMNFKSTKNINAFQENKLIKIV